MVQLRSKYDDMTEQTKALILLAKNKIMSLRLDQIQRLIAAVVASAMVLIYINSEQNFGETAVSMREFKSNSDILAIHQDLSPGNATLMLELLRTEPDSDAIAVGQHKARVIITNKVCTFPRFWIRMIGEALVSIELTQGTDTKKQMWDGIFTIPVEGTYIVDARWYGCSKDETKWIPLNSPIELHAVGSHSIPQQKPKEAHLFSNSAWLLSKNVTLPKYMWMDLESENRKEPDQLIKLEGKNFDTTVSLSGTATEKRGLYNFREVGNYELVCFWGSRTMHDIRESFLTIRPKLMPGQRPFKFHYYNVTNLVYPDLNWSQSDKERCRKCKHILVSVDEFDEPVSQIEYEKQIKTHVGHLQTLLNDTTFPIWVLSVNEPPMQASNCHTPTLPRTTDHPCNAVLKRIFQTGEENFTKQVHFLDNTDLVLPQFGENRDDLLSNIALRLYVAVGKGVYDWRKMNQFGKIDGLHRNDTVEPNFKQIPYEGWGTR